ncbi:MAG: Tfp pilus assembly protein PilF [Planctomycetota bacterium]|jgi:Tfp pilus assembly protein PilF
MRSERLSNLEKALVAAVVLIAFLLRLIYSFEAQASPYFEAPIMDPLFHLQWASALAEGTTIQDGPFFRAPLYPWFLGTLLRFFGEGLFLPRVAQAALGALSTFFVFLIGAHAFRFKAGLISAFLVAINWVLIYFDGELLIPTLAIPLNLCALWLSLRLADKPTPRNAGLAGIAWGVAALARPNVLLFMPFLFMWLVLRARPAWKTGLVRGLALTAGVITPILPISFYNYAVGGDTVLISSQAGVNLWIGNNPTSDGSTAIVPGTRPGWWDGFNDSIALAEQSEGRSLQPSEVSAHYTSRAWNFILEEPGAAFGHLLWKLRLFWTDWELGNNADIQFFAFHFSYLLRLLPPSFGLLAPLALLGLFCCRGSASRLFPLWGFGLSYMASVVIFFVCSRFRAPILPIFAVLAGPVLLNLVHALRAKRWKPLLLTLGALVSLCALMQRMPPGLDQTDAKGRWALGIHEMSVGKIGKAQEHFKEALAANPNYWIAHKDLGLAYQQAGELLQAQKSFLNALLIKPGDLQTSSVLVDVALARKDFGRAESAARKSLQANPAFPQAYDGLARVFVARGEWAQAREMLQAGLQRAPDDFFCNFRLGAVELQASNPCAAIEPFERARNARDAPSEGLRNAAAQAGQQARKDCDK